MLRIEILVIEIARFVSIKEPPGRPIWLRRTIGSKLIPAFPPALCHAKFRPSTRSMTRGQYSGNAG